MVSLVAGQVESVQCRSVGLVQFVMTGLLGYR